MGLRLPEGAGDGRGEPQEPVARPPRPRRSFFRRLPWEVRFAVLGLVYLGPPLALLFGGLFVYFTIRIPDPMALPSRERAPLVRLLARDGALLVERGGADSFVPYDLLPRHLIDAVIATEDRRFFQHRGIDTSGLLRAAYANARARRLVQGGSTLTQQLAKNLFLGPERTVRRKLEELVLALWLEMRLSKQDILELYLNRVYFGGGAYGVEAAARRYFGKSARDVSLAEAAVLAGLLKAPSRYSPAFNPAIAQARAHAVLARMVDAELLSEANRAAAAGAGIRFAQNLRRGQSGLDYAVDTVLEQLPALVGAAANELIVETTIDRDLQARAQAVLRDTLMREGVAAHATQAGLVLLDMDGGMQAIVGGRDYAESQFNRATRARRQPGSAFKPFVYLAALESGLTPDSTVLDLPLLGSGWSPRNEGAGYRGSVTLREALAQSMNAAAARLHLTVGPRRTVAVAQRLGIRSPLRAEASLALGTAEVSLLELTSAYGVLANGGVALDAHVVRRVRTPAGRVLYERPQPARTQLVAPAHVAGLNDMLQAVLTAGTGRRALLPLHLAAGKTGTSQDFRDAWFVGYTGQYVAGVWVGNDDGHSMNRVVGGSLPARIWRETMLLAHEGRPPVPLPGARDGIAVLAQRAAAVPPVERREPQPRQPQERIAADFVDRAIASPPRPDTAPSGVDAWVGAKRWLQTTQDALWRGLGLGS